MLCDRLVMALYACWWLGAAACPLNTRWSAPELAAALADMLKDGITDADVALGAASACGVGCGENAAGDELVGEGKAQLLHRVRPFLRAVGHGDEVGRGQVAAAVRRIGCWRDGRGVGGPHRTG